MVYEAHKDGGQKITRRRAKNHRYVTPTHAQNARIVVGMGNSFSSDAGHDIGGTLSGILFS